MLVRCIVSILFVASLVACTAKGPASVGDRTVTEEAISLRLKLYSNLKYNLSDIRYVALAQLVRGELAQQLLREAGIRIGVKELEDESVKREKAFFQTEEGKKQISELMVSGRKAFLQNLVLPSYAEQRLQQDVFSKSPEVAAVNEKKMTAAKQFLKEATAAPASFSRLAEKANLKVEKLSVSLKNGIKRYEGKEKTLISIPNSLKSKNLETDLSALSTGKVVATVVEWPEAYLVVCLVGREGADYIADSVFFEKMGFEEWFWSKAAPIEVRITEPKLRADFLKNVEWAKKINLR